MPNNYKHFRFFLLFVVVFLSACHARRAFTINAKQSQNYPVTATIADSTDNFPFLQIYRLAMQQKMNVQVGETLEDLKKEKPNSTLGNMVSDAMFLEARKTDTSVVAAVANYGGIRIPFIKKGAISLGLIFEVMPFDNNLCTVVLSGALVDTLCQSIAKSGGCPISNFEFDLEKDKAANIKIAGKPLQYERNYTFAFNDYQANGGDNCSFLIPLRKTLCGVLVRDAITNYVKTCSTQQKSLIINPTKRIH